MRSERRSSKPGAELTDVFLGTRKAGKHGAQLALIRVFRVSRVASAARVSRVARSREQLGAVVRNGKWRAVVRNGK